MKKTLLCGLVVTGILVGAGIKSFLYIKKEVDKMIKDLEK